MAIGVLGLDQCNLVRTQLQYENVLEEYYETPHVSKVD